MHHFVRKRLKKCLSKIFFERLIQIYFEMYKNELKLKLESNQRLQLPHTNQKGTVFSRKIPMITLSLGFGNTLIFIQKSSDIFTFLIQPWKFELS